MKLKNIFAIALSALLFTACSEDDPIGNFGTLTVDKNFVTMPTTDNSVTVKVTANSDWQLENLYSVDATIDGKKQKLYYPVPVTLNKEKTEGVPTWLTVDKTAGTAGETVLTLHADKTEAGRETEICINMGGLKQFVKVRQGELTAASATCAEIMNGVDGKNYRVTGRITKIAGMEYGNWYLDDGTYDFASTAKNQDGLYIYGTLDKKGKAGKVNPIDGEDGWGFEVGDVITVEGPLSIYSGTTYELVNVTVIKIEKSLLKVITPDAEFDTDGGQLEVKVAYKGSGAYFTIDDNAKSWISYENVSYKGGTKTIFEQNPADTAIYKFNVAPNTMDKRTGTINFSSSSGKNISQVAFNVTQKAFKLPHGKNPEDPFTVAEAIAKCQEIGSTTDGELYYAKGKISSIKEVSTSYGNATFNISDDGTDANPLTVYRSFFLNNEKFTAEDQIGVGDEVVIVGKLVNYTKGDQVTPEFSGNVYVYSIKKGSNDTAEAGTANKPFTVAEAFSYIDAGGSDDVYVEGIVSKIVYEFSASYGTGTFWISSDGVFNDDLTKDFEAYSVYWLGNKSWVEGNGQVAVGDKVVLCGKLTKYTKNDKSTYETSSKKAYVYSINGKTE
jgi:hypothetical protein